MTHVPDAGGVAVVSQGCREAGIALSMGARGCALDNTACEAFIGPLKKELVRRRDASILALWQLS